MIILYKEKQDCCGCTACVNICPVSAITLNDDEEGFKYPEISPDKCIECGLCKKVCAFQNRSTHSTIPEEPAVYAVKHVDEAVRMSSSSGGVFTAISDNILNKHGVVYGAAFDDNFEVIHKRAETKEQRDRFKGSKYVQSDVKDVCLQIKNDLSNELNVLFTGTPCQCAGVKRYLDESKCNRDRLILCDIVCHGTPSPLLWREHIQHISTKYNNIGSYKFRDKRVAWHGANVTITYDKDKELTNIPLIKSHANIYFSHLISRPACHNCKYTNITRESDITIADFWGIEKSMPEFDDNKGTSLVLVNTPKGEKLFEEMSCDIEYRQSNTTDCLQPQLQYPPKASPKRESFWRDYHAKGYSYIIKKYAGCGSANAIKRAVVKFLRCTGLLGIARKILQKGK